MSRPWPWLRRAMFGSWTHYMAQLPYNLNWSIELGHEEAAYLSRYPIVVCDIGARGTAPEELASLFPYVVYYAFDADATESARLAAQPHTFAEMRVFPRFIGGTSGVISFHLCAARGRSSVYHPSERYVSAFGDADLFRLDDTVDVVSSTLDQILVADRLRPPDILKLDTQGSEFDILREAKSALCSAHLVEVEVEFTAIYEGQPLFHDVARFLADEGYELLYLSRHFSQRKEFYKGPARGQVTYGDALFGRRDDRLQEASVDSLIKYALLLINYGHKDFALQIVTTYPQISAQLPSIMGYFTGDHHGSKAKRALVSQVDKLAMLWLHVRRYNGFNNDSDRSWPIR